MQQNKIIISVVKETETKLISVDVQLRSYAQAQSRHLLLFDEIILRAKSIVLNRHPYLKHVFVRSRLHSVKGFFQIRLVLGFKSTNIDK